MPKKKTTNGGYYEVKISYKDELTGQTKRKAFKSKKSLADARKKAEEFQVERKVRSIVGIKLDETSLKEWSETWLATYKKNKEAKTYESYERPLRLYILPYFGDISMNDIHPVQIAQFYNQLPPDHSDSFYHKIYLTLNGLLKDAVSNGLIDRNPHYGIPPVKGKAPAKKRIYTRSERDKLLAAAMNHPEGMAIVLLLCTGLRREELLALCWDNIDLIHKIITVDSAVKLSQNGAATIGPPKNDASYRQLPIDNRLTAYLDKHKSTGYVIHSPSGNYWNPNTWVSRSYKPVMAQLCTPLKLPDLNPHELRHTFGTLLYQATGDIYAVSKYLGHAGIDITARIYVHANTENLRSKIECLEVSTNEENGDKNQDELSTTVHETEKEKSAVTANAVTAG